MSIWIWDEISAELTGPLTQAEVDEIDADMKDPGTGEDSFALRKVHPNGVRELRSDRNHLALQVEAPDEHAAEAAFRACGLREYNEQYEEFLKVYAPETVKPEDPYVRYYIVISSGKRVIAQIGAGRGGLTPAEVCDYWSLPGGLKGVLAPITVELVWISPLGK